MTVYELIQELSKFQSDTKVEFHVNAEHYETTVEVNLDSTKSNCTEDVSVYIDFDEYVNFDDIEDNELKKYGHNVTINLKY